VSEPVRVAVQLGARTVRAAAAADDGEPWLVAELPSPVGTDRSVQVAALLAELIAPPDAAPLDELVLVHPAGERAARWWAGCAGLATTVRAVAAPVAAGAAQARDHGLVVLDVGFSGTEVTRLGGDGRVLGVRRSALGGRSLDELVAGRFARDASESALAEAGRVREALSLQASVESAWGPLTRAQLRPLLTAAFGAAVECVRDLVAAEPVPVLLVGGVARTPLLAELLDESGIADVTVAPRPDAAAVLGALLLPSEAGASTPVALGGRRTDSGESSWLGDRPRRRPMRVAAFAAAAAGLVVALLALGLLLAPGPQPAAAAGVLVQYGYRFEVPDGWEHSGGLPERRRALLTPVAAPEGSDLIAVEHSPLGYDSGAEPERAGAELRAEFAAAVAAGSRLSGYDPHARLAGRAGTAYRQEGEAGTVVEWFVVLDGDAQLSVGCRHTRANADAVRAACARVVASVGRA
jgi:type VII secretion-associated protein (TIGR03931 family)